jgi:uridylate kinase
MNYRFNKTVVIALGGSIMYPDAIDTAFIKKFKRFIAPFLRRKMRLVIVIGGGHLARVFQRAAAAVAPVTNEDKDWIGIHATRLNAHLLRTVFREIADPVIIDARNKFPKLTHPVTIAAGWRPGWSTDYVAAALAADFGAKEFVVAGKPDHVYDSDPCPPAGRPARKATPYETMSWREYRKLIPSEWTPGSHAPVDPVAARLAQREKLTAIIINGRDIANFGKLLRGKEFRGTIIT